MKNKEQILGAYESPIVEIIEVEVEKGFAVSTHVNGWESGGNLGNYETAE